MEISKEELAERFRTLSDEELLGRLDADLTPLALEVATAELKSRGIEPRVGAAERAHGANDFREAEHHPKDGEDLSDIDLATVAEFWDPVQANLLRGCLESAGIRVHVWGEHLATGNPFLSVASGGTRLQVRSDQVVEAKEVIAAYERGDFAMDEQADVDVPK